nr:10826_t:CDS:10 [Entrophospora candida]
MIIDRVDDNGNLSNLTPPIAQLRDSNFLKRLIQIDNECPSIEQTENMMIDECIFVKEIVMQLSEKIILWIEKRNNLIKDLQYEIDDATLSENGLMNSLQSENQRLNQLYIHVIKKIDAFHEKFHTKSFVINALKDELQMTKNKLEEKTERLESTEEQLRQAKKHMDRSKSASHGYLSDVKSQTLQGSQYNDNNSKPLENKLIQSQLLSESRLGELKEMSKEKANLKIEINKLLIESPLYKELLHQYLYRKEDLDHLHMFMEQNSREMEKLIATRNSATNQIQLNKLLTDLDSFCAQRDDVIIEADKLRATSPKDFYQINALRVISDDRKIIIKQLTNEIRRLHMKLAAQVGIKDAVDFYCNPVEPPEFSYNELKSGANTFELIQQKLSYDYHLQERLKQSEESRAKLEQQLKDYMNNATPYMREFQRMKITELEYKREVDKIKSQLEKYDEKYGMNDPNNDPIHVLTKKIEESAKKISKLETECCYLKKSEKELSQEIQVLGEYWTRKDEENTQKVFEIIAQDERIQIAMELELNARQKLNAAWTEQASLVKLKSLLFTVIQSQTDCIRPMKLLENNFKSQLENANKEMACSKQVINAYELQLIKMTQQQKETKEKIDKTYNSYIDLQKRYDNLTRSYENVSFKFRRLNEELEISKKKAKLLDNNQSNISAQLAYNYERLLKCSICVTRFKSHCIIKCMHVFCKECLDAQVKAQNRKCVTCGLVFNTTDIKQIFL